MRRGVGIVKLMGRDSGFVAMHAATAADVVDLCMIPEVKVEMKDSAQFCLRDWNVLGAVRGAWIIHPLQWRARTF